MPQNILLPLLAMGGITQKQSGSVLPNSHKFNLNGRELIPVKQIPQRKTTHTFTTATFSPLDSARWEAFLTRRREHCGRGAIKRPGLSGLPPNGEASKWSVTRRPSCRLVIRSVTLPLRLLRLRAAAETQHSSPREADAWQLIKAWRALITRVCVCVCFCRYSQAAEHEVKLAADASVCAAL